MLLSKSEQPSAAQNSTRDGLLSRTVCLNSEDKDAFEAFKQEYFDRYDPVGEPEIVLVEKIICAAWRQHRLWEIERVLLEREMHEVDPEYPLNVTQSAWRLATAFAKGLSTQDALERVSKMEGQLDRMAQRADRTLRLLQKDRPPSAQNYENEPVWQVVHCPPRETRAAKPSNSSNEPRPPENSQTPPAPTLMGHIWPEVRDDG